MTLQADFFHSVVACVDKAIKEPDLSGQIRSSIVEEQDCGGDLTLYIRGNPVVEVNFMSQPFLHLGDGAPDPLQVINADSATSLSGDGGRFSPEGLVQRIFSFLRNELKRVDGRS